MAQRTRRRLPSTLLESYRNVYVVLGTLVYFSRVVSQTRSRASDQANFNNTSPLEIVGPFKIIEFFGQCTVVLSAVQPGSKVRVVELGRAVNGYCNCQIQCHHWVVESRA